MYSITIDGTKYDANIVKTCELINIGITNSQTKISYSVCLDKEKIYKITSDAGLVRDIDKFYEIIKIGLCNDNINIILTGKIKNEILVLNLAMCLVKELGDVINYVIKLDLIVKSDIERVEEIFTEIIHINDNLNKKISDAIEKEVINMNGIINKKINDVVEKEVINIIEKKINSCYEKKWNSIPNDDINYCFGHKNGFRIESYNYNNDGCLRLKKNDNSTSICGIIELVVPQKIIQKANKIRVLLNTSSANFEGFYIKIWTQENDIRHISRFDKKNPNGIQIQGGIIMEIIFNITPLDNKIYLKGSIAGTLNVYLTGYKQKF